ncbi:hypothetical protein AWB81_07167 [Caballeronia arationis]|uniref:hypothetical protein n=1 Tax=Caballeronia arationis TaxID=1777142 RepID=UPI00074B5838|nr:hypothetical protein [Caballeronia arationis]SAL05453.1 hypothetical protein AWB81_07167 [Caballeronia arationis]
MRRTTYNGWGFALFFSVIVVSAAKQTRAADFDCSGLLPPGTSVSQNGETQIKLAANAILKAVKGDADVKVTSSQNVQSAQQNAPTDDPQAIRSRTLYLFCGLMLKATDIDSNRKFEMLMQLQGMNQPPLPPSPPPIPEENFDLVARLGLPPLGTSRDAVEKFAAERRGSSRTADNGRYVLFRGSLSEQPAEITLWIDSDEKLRTVVWKVEGYREHHTNDHYPGKTFRTADGPDPTSTCTRFVDDLVIFLANKMGVTPTTVSQTTPRATDAWNFVPRGIPRACDDSSGSDCSAHAYPTDRDAVLSRGHQKVTVRARLVHVTWHHTLSDGNDMDHTVDQCTVQVLAENVRF